MQNSSTSLQLYQQGFRSSLSCFDCVGLQHFGEWPVLRSLSRLRLLCFEARLSGYCVREGGGQGSQPGFLVLAFSMRTLKSSGVPARRVQSGGFCASMLAFVCSTSACRGLLVVGAFSLGPPLLLFRRLCLQQYAPACLIDMCLLHLAHVVRVRSPVTMHP